MPTDTSVKYFASTMANAPLIIGGAGALINVLDACLVNGFNNVTVNTISVSGGVATCTVTAGHNYAAIGTTGPVIRIADATPAGLNGDKRVTITDNYIFTYDATGISNTTTSGTATRAPLGFAKVYSDSYKGAYQSQALGTTGKYIRIDDNYDGKNAIVHMYGTMSGIDTGTEPAPSSGNYYCYKSSTADGTSRPWALFGDNYFFWLVIASNGTNSYGGFYFGDPIKLSSTDQHCCLLGANTAANTNFASTVLNSTAGRLIARSYTGGAGVVTHSMRSHGVSGASLGTNGEAYPSVITGGVNLYPVDVWENNTMLRAIVPGLWNPLHNNPTGYQGTALTNIPQLPGRTLYFLPYGMYTANFVPIDITGPWRDLYV